MALLSKNSCPAARFRVPLPAPSGIYPEENEEQDGETPERRAAIAEEGQGDADDGGQAEYHPDVDEDVEEEDAQHAVPIDAAKRVWLSLGQMQEAEDEREEEQQHDGTADEALLLAYGAEDEVGVLLRHVFELRLSAVQEALALKPARADGNFGLYDIVAHAARVVLQPEQDLDARLLVRLQDVVHREVRAVVEGEASQREEGNEGVGQGAVSKREVEQIEHRRRADGHHHPHGIEGIDEARDQHGTGRQCQPPP